MYAHLQTVMSKDLFQQVSATFGLVEVAEQEIEAAMKKWPEKKVVLWRAFSVLHTPALEGTPTKIWRTHFRQYLRNLAQGLDPDLPTRIEVAVMTVRASTVAPPTRSITDVFTSDQETMAAFGQDSLPTPYPEDQEMWLQETGKRILRNLYIKTMGETRSKLLAREVKRGTPPCWTKAE